MFGDFHPAFPSHPGKALSFPRYGHWSVFFLCGTGLLYCPLVIRDRVAHQEALNTFISNPIFSFSIPRPMFSLSTCPCHHSCHSQVLSLLYSWFNIKPGQSGTQSSACSLNTICATLTQKHNKIILKTIGVTITNSAEHMCLPSVVLHLVKDSLNINDFMAPGSSLQSCPFGSWKPQYNFMFVLISSASQRPHSSQPPT